MSLAKRFLLLQLGLVVVISVVVALVMVQQTRTWVTLRAESATRAATTVIAEDPYVRQALTSQNPSERLQSYTQRLEAETDIDFVTVMTPQGRRITHPVPEYVGKQYEGDRTRALAGETATVTETGRLGPSVRTIAPVRDTDGTIVGLVSTGVLLNQIAQDNRQQLPGLALIVVALLLASSLVSYLLSRYLNRITNGQPPESLVRSQALNDVVLDEAREGLVLLDTLDRPVLTNARARHLLDMSHDTLPRAVRDLFADRSEFTDRWCTVGTRTLVVSLVGARTARGLRVLIVQDHTELVRLSGELDTVRTMTAGLRAQTHEHANRMHTVVSLLELQRYPQALEFASSDLNVTRALSDTVGETVLDPYLSALLLGKTAEGRERGVDVRVLVHEQVPVTAADPSDVVSVVGNLLDNAIDAASFHRAAAEPVVEVEFTPSERVGFMQLTVADTGPGVAVSVRDTLFERGVSTKPAGEASRGVGLHLAYRIAQSWGSELRFVNDAGAVFTVDIPVRSEPAGPGEVWA